MSLFKHARTQPLTIINPQAFISLSDIKAKLLLESITDSVSANIQNALDILGRDINNAYPRIGTLVNKIAGEVLKANGVSEDTLDYFKFRINPLKLSVPKKKISDIKYTGAGYDIDIRGQELIMYQYQGSTGSLMPDNILDKIGTEYLNELFSLLNLGQELLNSNIQRLPEITRNPKLSNAYIKFKLFELFWEQNNDDLLIFWEDECFLGKFLTFNYTIDGESPYQIKYDFNFAVYPEFKFGVYTGWITDSDFDIIKSNFTKFRGLSESNVVDTVSLSEAKRTGSVRPTSSLNSQEQSELDWFASLGAFPYNKNRNLFLKNFLIGSPIEMSRITPKQLADWYKANKNIDIFDDNISFGLNSGRKISESSIQGENQAKVDIEEIKKEKEIKVQQEIYQDFTH